jgi:repressor LexA
MKVYTTRWQIFDFVRKFVEEKDYAPTIGEIQKALGISSTSVVDYHLRALDEEGLITREPEVSRGIHVSGIGRKARAVPLLGTITAGEPIPVPTEETWYTVVHETVEVPAEMLSRQVKAFALRVEGKSMIDAFVDDGDIIVLEATPAAENGQMVVAWLTDEQKVTLKKIYYEPKRIRLQPANPSMAPIYVNPDNIQIQGRVIGVLRRYPEGELPRAGQQPA